MSVNLGKGSAFLLLGILGAVIGTIVYYNRKTHPSSSEGKWPVGATLILASEEYLISEKKWRPDAYVFAGDEEIYPAQWWYKLDNGAWYPEEWLESSIT